MSSDKPQILSVNPKHYGKSTMASDLLAATLRIKELEAEIDKRDCLEAGWSSAEQGYKERQFELKARIAELDEAVTALCKERDEYHDILEIEQKKVANRDAVIEQYRHYSLEASKGRFKYWLLKLSEEIKRQRKAKGE